LSDDATTLPAFRAHPAWRSPLVETNSSSCNPTNATHNRPPFLSPPPPGSQPPKPGIRREVPPPGFSLFFRFRTRIIRKESHLIFSFTTHFLQSRVPLFWRKFLTSSFFVSLLFFFMGKPPIVDFPPLFVSRPPFFPSPRFLRRSGLPYESLYF